MATRTTNIGLTKPANNERGWDVPIREDLDRLDASAAVRSLAVREVEIPSTTRNVKVAAGDFRKADGTTVSYAGAASLTLSASATHYLWLTDAGTLASNTSGFPAATNVVPLAVVVVGTTTITSITDARRPWFSFGDEAANGTVTIVSAIVPAGFTVDVDDETTTPALDFDYDDDWTAHYVLIGPASGSPGTPSRRLLAYSDLPLYPPYTATDGAVVNFDMANGPNQRVVIAGNRTFSISGDANGTRIEIAIKQDVYGSRTVTWWVGVDWGDADPTPTTAANKVDVFLIERLSSGVYRGYVLGKNYGV